MTSACMHCTHHLPLAPVWLGLSLCATKRHSLLDRYISKGVRAGESNLIQACAGDFWNQGRDGNTYTLIARPSKGVCTRSEIPSRVWHSSSCARNAARNGSLKN